jgi:hypothetical protein
MVRVHCLFVLTACLLFACHKTAVACPPSDEPSNCIVVELSSNAQRRADEMEREIREGRLRERANVSLDAMIRYAAWKLRKKGHRLEAQKMLVEWETTWNGYLLRVGRKPGDQSHAPLSQWLQEKTNMLILLLGVEVMKATRLWDLVVFNESFRVVFQCIDNVDEIEFGDYFVPFSGVVSYWVSYVSITAATWGAGFWFAGPIAMGVELIVVKAVAPKLNHGAWQWSCN